MRNPAPVIIQALRSFESALSEQLWEWAKILLVGALLGPGKRTVTSALRVTGLAQECQFQTFHRVLNRAAWSCGTLSRNLLHLLLHTYAPMMRRWSSGWMNISNAAGGQRSPGTVGVKGFTAMRYARAKRSSSKRVRCGGAA